MGVWGVVYVYDGRAHREESFATLVPCLQPMLRGGIGARLGPENSSTEQYAFLSAPHNPPSNGASRTRYRGAVGGPPLTTRGSEVLCVLYRLQTDKRIGRVGCM